MEVNDVIDMLGSIRVEDVDMHIRKLETRRAKATAEFDEGIKKLKRLRRTLFGSCKPKREGITPTEAVVDTVRKLGSATAAEIAEYAGMSGSGVSAVLRIKSKLFKVTSDGVYSLAKGTK